ncbi:MAG: anti-sigma factor family protein [Gemmatimonadota bacterium]
MSDHLRWDVLNDYVDDRLAADQRAVVASHLLSCANCRAELDSLRAVVRIAGSLEAEEAAPDAPTLWSRIEATVTRQEAVRRWQRPPVLAAAAAVLVLLSSAVTAGLLRDGQDRGAKVAAVESLPPVILASERRFLADVDELRDLLDERRPLLRRETIAIVERNLDAIDQAIAESRAALAADPGNNAIAEVLAAGYRHKLELLRRATELEDVGVT